MEKEVYTVVNNKEKGEWRVLCFCFCNFMID